MTHSEIIVNHHYHGLNPILFGYEINRPAHAYGPAVRTFWLLHYVVSGFGRFARGGVTHQLGPGEVFVIPPYEQTRYEADPSHPWDYIWIGFQVEGEIPEVLQTSVIRCAAAGQIFEDMKRCGSLESGRSAFLAGQLWLLLALLSDTAGAKTDFVDKAVSCIRSEYMTDLTVASLSERLGVDRSYFSAQFKKRTGQPPGQYLAHYRLQKAAELLTTYGQPPSMAALSTGHSDLFHFSRMFKRFFGVSPRAYYRAAVNSSSPSNTITKREGSL